MSAAHRIVGIHVDFVGAGAEKHGTVSTVGVDDDELTGDWQKRAARNVESDELLVASCCHEDGELGRSGVGLEGFDELVDGEDEGLRVLGIYSVWSDVSDCGRWVDRG